MGLIDITRRSETVPEPETDATDVDTDEHGRDGRRWRLVVAGIVVLAVAVYLVSRRRTAREAEFTEIELEPTPSEPESESESPS